MVSNEESPQTDEITKGIIFQCGEVMLDAGFWMLVENPENRR
jgi:hypothetical protein